jgi:predicted transcriptional regulator
MTDAIFSIRPYFADAILDGSKTVELRKVAPKKPVERVWIYATAPVMHIVGHFEPGKIRDATHEDRKQALVSELDPDEYFAIEILEPVALEHPINPRNLGLGYLWLSPQSWRYAGLKEQTAFREQEGKA